MNRYTLFSGVVANPDRRENYQVHKDGARVPAIPLNASAPAAAQSYIVNYKDAVSGFVMNGSLPVSDAQGVHSLTDVPVFAMGPCQGSFSGVYSSTDIFFGIANCFGLSRGLNNTSLGGAVGGGSSSSSSSSTRQVSSSKMADVKTVTVTVTASANCHTAW